MSSQSCVPVIVLAARGASGLDVYGWMGSLATYGFIVAYALMTLALPGYLKAHGAYRPSKRILDRRARLCFSLSSAISIPSPEGPYGKLPYIYLAYLVGGLWFFWRERNSATASIERC